MSAAIACYVIVFATLGFLCVLCAILEAFADRERFRAREVRRQMRRCR